MRLLLVFVAAAAFLPCSLAAPNPFIHVDASQSPGQFVDAFGRARIFHGVAAIVKEFPYYPILDHFDAAMSLSDSDMDNLAAWGFTAVRLMMAWPGVFPSPNTPNITYLQVVETIVNNLGARGIYTILDAHQDDWSPRFCGEGAPDWAVLPYLNESAAFPLPIAQPYNLTPDGYPSRADCLKSSFALYYPTAAVGNAFQDFYTNTHGLADAFAVFWSTVAKYFQSNPYVLSYELLNEPWAGDVLKIPELVLPHVADNQNLLPLYQQLHSAIRAFDDQHTILFEPAVFFTSLPFGNLTTSGFTEGPGGPSYNDRQAFSYHVYCDLNSTGQPSIPWVCSLYEGVLMDMRMQDLKNLGMAGFLTEFGAYSNGFGDDLTDANHLLGLADANLQSWSYWQFKSYGDPTTSDVDAQGVVLEGFYNETTGKLDETKVHMLARPYAIAVGGRYKSMNFDVTSLQFTVSYTVDTTAVSKDGVNTEIYTGAPYYYPNGFNVNIVPPIAITTSNTTISRLYVHHTSAATDGEVVTITLTPQ